MYVTIALLEKIINCIDLLPGIVFVKNNEGRYLAGNQAFADFARIPREIIPGRTDHSMPWSMYARDLAQRECNLYSKDYKAHLVTTDVYRYADGTIRYLLCNKSLLEIDGDVFGFLCIAADITPTEEKSSNQNTTTNDILNNIPSDIYWQNVDGTMIDCNQSALKTFGCTDISSFKGRKLLDFLSSNPSLIHWNAQLQKLDALDNIVISTQKESVTQGVNKENKKYLFKKKPIFDNQNKLVSIMTVALDISDIKD